MISAVLVILGIQSIGLGSGKDCELQHKTGQI